jgi:hypothetical protein
MLTSVHTLKGADKILISLAEFQYLTARQLTRLLYAPSSLVYVQKQLKSLTDTGLIIALPGRFVNMPAVYTLTGKGYTYTTALGMPQRKRVRPMEEREKAPNVFFIQHTMAVSDVLIRHGFSPKRTLTFCLPACTQNRS